MLLFPKLFVHMWLSLRLSQTVGIPQDTETVAHWGYQGRAIVREWGELRQIGAWHGQRDGQEHNIRIITLYDQGLVFDTVSLVYCQRGADFNGFLSYQKY